MSIESTESDDAGMEAAARATELASELGTALSELDSYRRFEAAKEAVENSEEAQEKIREFERLREEFQMARQTGDASNEDLERLQAAQQELHDVPEMDEYLTAQSEMEMDLEDINRMISAPLAVDFGEKAGGCCQD
ncbi:YlbF family regulator [Halosegnis marinus]|uniref:YlbF family regulator n=1 Tax=Halosegnis marinus TaxID=3034023 RepID=A0ABD5ZSE0_9EURY|nr:YlbF family regulator [Halosegnis sp. DT85]